MLERGRRVAMIFEACCADDLPRVVVHKAVQLYDRFMQKRAWKPLFGIVGDILCVNACISIAAKYEMGFWGGWKDLESEFGQMFGIREFIFMEIAVLKSVDYKLSEPCLLQHAILSGYEEPTPTELFRMDMHLLHHVSSRGRSKSVIQNALRSRRDGIPADVKVPPSVSAFPDYASLLKMYR